MSLYFLLEEIRDRRSFSQAGNCVHGVQNDPFCLCSPSEKRSVVFRDRHTKAFCRLLRSMRRSAQEFDGWLGPLTGLSTGGYYPRWHGITRGMSVNPRSNLTRRTPEGPIEKRSGKEVLASLIIAFMFFTERCLRSTGKRMSCPLVPVLCTTHAGGCQYDEAHGMAVACVPTDSDNFG